MIIEAIMFLNPHSLIALDLHGNNLRGFLCKKLGRVYHDKIGQDSLNGTLITMEDGGFGFILMISNHGGCSNYGISLYLSPNPPYLRLVPTWPVPEN